MLQLLISRQNENFGAKMSQMATELCGAVYSVHCAVLSAQWKVLYVVHSVQYTVHSALCSLHYLVHIS